MSWPERRRTERLTARLANSLALFCSIQRLHRPELNWQPGSKLPEQLSWTLINHEKNQNWYWISIWFVTYQCEVWTKQSWNLFDKKSYHYSVCLCLSACVFVFVCDFSFTLDNSWWYNTIIYTGVALTLPLSAISYCYYHIWRLASKSQFTICYIASQPVLCGLVMTTLSGVQWWSKTNYFPPMVPWNESLSLTPPPH